MLLPPRRSSPLWVRSAPEGGLCNAIPARRGPETVTITTFWISTIVWETQNLCHGETGQPKLNAENKNSVRTRHRTVNIELNSLTGFTPLRGRQLIKPDEKLNGHPPCRFLPSPTHLLWTTRRSAVAACCLWLHRTMSRPSSPTRKHCGTLRIREAVTLRFMSHF